MLKVYGNRFGLRNLIILTALLPLIASCGPREVDEERFSLYMENKNFSDLVRVINEYSSRHGYHVTLETLQGNRPETTAQHIMVEGDGMRTLVQSALAEQCKEREGRRDVEYSHRIFDVNAFSTSYFKSNAEISKQVDSFKSELTKSGFRIVSKRESCNLL
ncbi:hypothetical protein [Blastomonas sp.]|uniref:hypothetical protein n=1 Tax=Blastomonas sp. TaxID=1909299 RepID=UPI00391CD958